MGLDQYLTAELYIWFDQEELQDKVRKVNESPTGLTVIPVIHS